MKTISGKIFNVKIKIDRTQDDGLCKSVKEDYAVKAVNFTDCEAKITKEIGSADNVKDSFDVLAEVIAPYTYHYLLNATSIEQARKNIADVYGQSVRDYTIAAIIEQKIIEVFE